MGSEPAQLTDKIRAAFGACTVGHWPTPLEHAPGLARVLGASALWVKREDRSSGRCGGNKVRGLEFLLAGAPPRTVFVTLGSTGSTHCLSTAVHASALGHHVALAQFPQPETAVSRAVAEACAAHAAFVERAGTRAGLPWAVLRAWRRARRLGRRRWIPGGGAHPCAVVGHFLAALELAEQSAAPPDAIVTPLGTGSTAAGLVLGVGALAWPTRVIGVRVAPAAVANRWRTAWLARAAARLLARHGVPVPRPRSLFPLVLDGLGRGYGYPSAAGEAARREALEHGLVLDSTYGAKAFAALQPLAARGISRIVFWHTFALPPSTPLAHGSTAGDRSAYR